LFIPPTIIFLLLRKQSKLLLLASSFLGLCLLTIMYFLLNKAFTGGGDMDAMKPFKEEHVICFVPMNPAGANLNLIVSNHPLHEMFYYIINNPGHFFKLMGLKLLSFFNLTRPYYSTPHNSFL